MDTKLCRYCKIEQPLNNFEIANIIKGKKYHRCKCRNCYCETKKALRYKKTKWFIDLKKTLKCQECNNDDFRVLEFHHRADSSKDGNISNLITRWSLERVQKEIDKCDVLCANCHRIVHWEERKLP